MATTEPNPGSFVVINQVNPQANQTEPEGLNSNVPANLPKPVIKFYKGEPEALGSTQICIGTIFITFGIPLTAFPEIYYYIPDPMVLTGVLFWTGIMYILAGSLSVSASIKPTVGKVKASLVLNIISSVLAFIALIIIVITMTSFSFNLGHSSYCAYYGPSQECEGEYKKRNLLCGIATTFFIFTVLAFTINISIAAFGCKTVCRTSYNEMSVVIYQTATSNVPSANAAQPIDILKT